MDMDKTDFIHMHMDWRSMFGTTGEHLVDVDMEKILSISIWARQ